MLMSVNAPIIQAGRLARIHLFAAQRAGAAVPPRPLLETDRRRWLDLMQRDSGIAFLWTRDRWEAPYVIFVVRDGFARVYAFSPHGFEAAARMTPDMVQVMVDWLGQLWFPEAGTDQDTAPEPLADGWEHRPTLPRHPSPDHSDAPGDQWDEGADTSSGSLEW